MGEHKRKQSNLIPYADLHTIEEDKRIEIIGKAVLASRQVVAVLVDDEPGKADRYISKLTDRFPGIRIIDRFKGPVAGAETIKMAPPEAENN